MSRRAILILALACLGLLAAAIAPWTVTTSGLTESVGRQLKALYGLDLSVAGRSTVAFLPVPRLKLEDVALSGEDGAPIVRAEQLRGEFRILPLFIGRVELAELSLNGVEIRVHTGPGGRNGWDGVAASLRGQVEGGRSGTKHIRRVILTNAAVSIKDERSGFSTNVSELNAVANWPAADAVLDMTAAAVWRNERVEVSASGLEPAALLQGRKNLFTLQATTPVARLRLDGDATLSPEPRLSGRAAVNVRSVRDLAIWSGLHFPLGTSIAGASLDGDFTASRGVVSWPAVRLAVGTDRLDGALQAQAENGRLSFTGTLAADRLTLPDFFRSTGQGRAGSSWDAEDPSLSGLTGADLDLRLSAAEARLGKVKLEDLAANLMVRDGRIEASLGRATLNRGIVKGRLGLTLIPAGLDLKLQSAFDRVDLGALLADIGQSRWITGVAQGQVVLDALGDAPDLLRQLQGRASVTVRQGELVGIGFNDVLRRAERRPLSTPAEWKGGRTSFDQAHVALNINRGVGEIAEGHVAAPTVRAALQGRVSLVERSFTVKATVEGQGALVSATPLPLPPLVFDITGPWDDPAMVPDAHALIQRSGAARQLLRPEPKKAGGDALETPSPVAQ
jgi:AsmA protein